MNTETLIRMANQIANNFVAYPADVAKAKLATHLERFWEPRMLSDLFAYVDKDGQGIQPIVREAALVLKAKH